MSSTQKREWNEDEDEDEGVAGKQKWGQ